MRLLVVEDDDGIAEPLVSGLRREGFEVERVATGAAALDAPEPDLVLLDLRLPDIDGYSVARAMRARSRVPIIMVTAKGEEVDRVVGLELGADDYVVKPFGLRELVARINAVMRRVAESPEPDPVLVVGDLEIDSRQHLVLLAGEEIALTPKEFDLLSLLAADPGRGGQPPPHAGGGLGHALVRADEDHRRPHLLAAPQARRPGVDRDRPRRRLPPALPVTRRLVATYLILAAVVLVALEVPLGIVHARSQRDDLQTRVERDAVALGALVEDTLQEGAPPGDPALLRIVDRYAASTGARVVITGPDGAPAGRLRRHARPLARLLLAPRDRVGPRG